MKVSIAQLANPNQETTLTNARLVTIALRVHPINLNVLLVLTNIRNIKSSVSHVPPVTTVFKAPQIPLSVLQEPTAWLTQQHTLLAQLENICLTLAPQLIVLHVLPVSTVVRLVLMPLLEIVMLDMSALSFLTQTNLNLLLKVVTSANKDITVQLLQDSNFNAHLEKLAPTQA